MDSTSSELTSDLNCAATSAAAAAVSGEAPGGFSMAHPLPPPRRELVQRMRAGASRVGGEATGLWDRL